MKILMISAIPCFPTIEGARIRILSLSRLLSQMGHDLQFVYMPTWEGIKFDAQAHVSEFGTGNFHILSARNRLDKMRSRIRRALRKAKTGWHTPYSGLDDFYSSRWNRELQEKVGDLSRFDVVMVEYISHSRAFLAFPSSCLKILDTHNRFTDRHLGADGRIKECYWFSLTREDETRGLSRANAVVAIQQDESRLFRHMLSNAAVDVAVVSHIFDPPPELIEKTEDGVLFFGGANDANKEAVRYFTENVLPLVRETHPDFKLTLAGSICNGVPDDTGSLAKLGLVDNLNDAFSRAAISVNPMLTGEGISIKLLESMSRGIPSVSTATGARGVPVEFLNGVTVVPDHDAAGAAYAICELLSDRAKRKTMGESAFQDSLRWQEEQIASLDKLLNPAA